MPNLIAHYLCGKLVCDKLKIENKKQFLYGCIAPDYDKRIGHFKEQHGVLMTPNLENFMFDTDAFEDYEKGNFCHLALDKVFLEEYVPEEICKGKEVSLELFTPDNIYRDYSIVSKDLLEHFGSSLDEIVEVCKNKSNFNYERFDKVISEISACTGDEKLKHLDAKSFAAFIEKAAETVAKQIEQASNQKRLGRWLKTLNNKNK